MSDALLPHLVVEPEEGTVDRAIIWLHGLGATCDDFEAFFEAMELPSTRVILPQAKTIPVTLNGGYPMPAWFDVESLDRDRALDAPGLQRTRRHLEAFLAQLEADGIPSHRVILGGFSQGGAVSLYVGTRLPKTLAGIAGLSTWLLAAEALPSERAEANATTKVYMGHGTADPIVRFEYGKSSAEVLRTAGHPVTFFESRIAHSVGAEEAKELRRWILESFT